MVSYKQDQALKIMTIKEIYTRCLAAAERWREEWESNERFKPDTFAAGAAHAYYDIAAKLENTEEINPTKSTDCNK